MGEEVIRVRYAGERDEGVKTDSSVEALYALVFAVCVLLALFLLTN